MLEAGAVDAEDVLDIVEAAEDMLGRSRLRGAADELALLWLLVDGTRWRCVGGGAEPFPFTEAWEVPVLPVRERPGVLLLEVVRRRPLPSPLFEFKDVFELLFSRA